MHNFRSEKQEKSAEILENACKEKKYFKQIQKFQSHLLCQGIGGQESVSLFTE